MPKRTDIHKVLIIGSGPIIIGQAAEFDYAGTQACRALKEEGLEVVLVNSNPATIMTDKAMADHVYIEPLNLDVVKSDTSHSSHYWSLIDVGDGWYHFDTTPRYGGGEFFLLTDAELEAYSVAHNNSHIFDKSLYPATPTEDSTVE